MDCRTLDVTIVSAEDLKKGIWFGKMQPYAIAWVDPYYRLSTQVDTDGETKPTWNQKLSFPVPEYFFQQPNSRLTVEIYSRRSILGNRFVGWAVIPFSDILQQSNPEEILTYQLRKRSGKVKGSLRLSVRVGEKAAAAGSGSAPASSEPVAAYPPVYDYKKQPQQPPYPSQPYGNYQAYPPQPYPPYPSQPYGNYQAYPPQPYPTQGYGGQAYYAPVGQQPPYVRPPTRPGMGFGTGLVAGAVGGLIVGDIIDDVAFDNGGYDDGGFDGGF